jgi:hypothetical protein
MTTVRAQPTRRRRVGRCLLALAALVLGLGCYSYVPADLAAVPVGSHIRAIVRGTAADRLRAAYGVAGPALDGRLVAREAEMLTLSVPSVPLGSPLGTHALYQQVPVAAADVVGVDVRKVDAFRTGAIVAVGAVAATALAAKALSGGSGGTGSGTGGGPTESVRRWTLHLVIPLF